MWIWFVWSCVLSILGRYFCICGRVNNVWLLSSLWSNMDENKRKKIKEAASRRQLMRKKNQKPIVCVRFKRVLLHLHQHKNKGQKRARLKWCVQVTFIFRGPHHLHIPSCCIISYVFQFTFLLHSLWPL